MIANLYILTGASGVGKSTILPILKKRLSENFLIYDYDEILRPYDLSDTWVNEVTEKMMEITETNILDKKTTIFVGLIRPYMVKKYQDKYKIKDIKFCLLDITTEERKRRLKQRKSTMSPIRGIEEHEGFRIWINESGYPYSIIDVTSLSPEEVADKFITIYNLA